jgi:hypothetical protein
LGAANREVFHFPGKRAGRYSNVSPGLFCFEVFASEDSSFEEAGKPAIILGVKGAMPPASSVW